MTKKLVFKNVILIKHIFIYMIINPLQLAANEPIFKLPLVKKGCSGGRINLSHTTHKQDIQDLGHKLSLRGLGFGSRACKLRLSL